MALRPSRNFWTRSAERRLAAPRRRANAPSRWAPSTSRRLNGTAGAETAALLWKTQVEEHRLARITGAPVLHAGRLYVPVSSAEEVTSRSVRYECCTFRGSLVALDADTGKTIWKTHTIADEPAKTRTN